ncbi:MAG: hypothetical protein E7396_03615 [Ruminococcaceae bacterium]|nr:hypothetical protein [Oscillospiraceae bacterium]
MSFWEEFAEKAKEGAQKVQVFTMETVDKVKLKARLSKLNNDVSKLYTEIGKLVYLERCGDTFEDYSEKLSQYLESITNLKDQINEIEKQLEDL